MLVVCMGLEPVEIQIVDCLVQLSVALWRSSCLFVVSVRKRELWLTDIDFHFTMSEPLVSGRAELRAAAQPLWNT